MAFKYNTYTLKKLETIFHEMDYSVLYEKGNFQSGYCLVQQKRVVVVNKFFETEGRVNTLLEILGVIEIDESLLSEASRKFFKKIGKNSGDEGVEEEEELKE